MLLRKLSVNSHTSPDNTESLMLIRGQHAFGDLGNTSLCPPNTASSRVLLMLLPQHTKCSFHSPLYSGLKILHLIIGI